MTSTYPGTGVPVHGTAVPALFYLDASAWVKSYLVEPGTDWVRQFWATSPECACATLGFVEVLATVVRRNTGAHVPPAVTDGIIDSVRRDFAGFVQVHFGVDALRIAEDLPRRHTLRGADSVHLASALLLRQATGRAITMIASDLELLEASRREGFTVLDPATNPSQPVGPSVPPSP